MRLPSPPPAPVRLSAVLLVALLAAGCDRAPDVTAADAAAPGEPRAPATPGDPMETTRDALDVVAAEAAFAAEDARSDAEVTAERADDVAEGDAVD